MVLERRPRVHGDGPKLDLRIVSLDGTQNHMIAAIPVWLGVAAVVAFLDDFDLRIARQVIAHGIHVAQEAADDAYAERVGNLRQRRLGGYGQAFAPELLAHAVVRLYAREDMLDGIHLQLVAHGGAQVFDAIDETIEHLLHLQPMAAINVFVR